MSNRFIKVDNNNIVEKIIIADSIEWCIDNFGGKWLENIQDGSIGDTYDSNLNKLISPQPYKSWVLVNGEWVAPVPYSNYKNCENSGHCPIWDEENLNWKE